MTWRTTERLAVRVGKIRWVYGRLWKVCVELWCVTHSFSYNETWREAAVLGGGRR